MSRRLALCVAASVTIAAAAAPQQPAPQAPQPGATIRPSGKKAVARRNPAEPQLLCDGSALQAGCAARLRERGDSRASGPRAGCGRGGRWPRASELASPRNRSAEGLVQPVPLLAGASRARTPTRSTATTAARARFSGASISAGTSITASGTSTATDVDVNSQRPTPNSQLPKRVDRTIWVEGADSREFARPLTQHSRTSCLGSWKLGVESIAYSSLSARAGSMRVARRAGSQAASAPIARSTSAAPTNVKGSRGSRP
jgi:hypothetical protein